MMFNTNEILVIKKAKLEGQVCISGAKNSALKLLSASILTDEDIEIGNSPNTLLDVIIHLSMLQKLGKNCLVKDDYVKISEPSSTLINELIWEDRSIRNTLLILGCLTTRFGEGCVPLPGGCKIGDRKHDIHISILEKLGANVWEENGYIFAKVKNKKLKGTDLFLPIRSTGATENGILCGVLAEGKTTIWNPHIRPEIIDLIDFLKNMGANIEVHGQKCIIITGVSKLKGTQHTVIPDNVEAITWVIASVITGGDIEILNFPYKHLEVPLIFLRESGTKYYKGSNSLIVRGGKPLPIEISTAPYPGINSDMQPLFAVYGAMSEGLSKIIDLRFPGRYEYVKELGKMGVKYSIKGDILIIEGGNPLIGSNVTATDLRSGMALILAGLTAAGETTISNYWQIKRGYEHIEQKLLNLGANLL